MITMKNNGRFIAVALTIGLALGVAFGPSYLPRVFAQTLGTGQAQTIPAITLTNTTNQLVLGTTNTVTISSTAPSGGRTYTLPDVGAAANFGLFANTPAAIQTYPQTIYATAGYTNATNTLSNVTGVSFAVAASTNYHATCYLTWNPGGATTVGPKYAWTGPASPTNLTSSGWLSKTVTTLSPLSVSTNAFASTTLDDAVAVTASITQTDIVSLGIVNGVNAGTIQLQAALHSASGTYTLQTGSYCIVQ